MKDRPEQVYLELYNEPHDKLTEAKWNDALAKLIPVVRKTNPTRPIIVGPGQWNAIRALDKLKLPADDHNLILTVHFYDPFHFTHQALLGGRRGQVEGDKVDRNAGRAKRDSQVV